MTRKWEGSGWRIAFGAGFASSQPNTPMLVGFELRDFPGWWVVIAITPSGTPAGFQVRPAMEAPPGDGPDRVRRLAEHMRSWAVPPEAPAITARMLRQIPVGELQKAARASWERTSDFHRRIARGFPGGSSPVVEAMASRPGRRGRSDHDYALLAAAYVEAIRDGEAIADFANRLHLAASTVRNQLYTARHRGLLTEAPRGRAGGDLTDRALELLNAED